MAPIVAPILKLAIFRTTVVFVILLISVSVVSIVTIVLKVVPFVIALSRTIVAKFAILTRSADLGHGDVIVHLVVFVLVVAPVLFPLAADDEEKDGGNEPDDTTNPEQEDRIWECFSRQTFTRCEIEHVGDEDCHQHSYGHGTEP